MFVCKGVLHPTLTQIHFWEGLVGLLHQRQRQNPPYLPIWSPQEQRRGVSSGVSGLAQVSTELVSPGTRGALPDHRHRVTSYCSTPCSLHKLQDSEQLCQLLCFHQLTHFCRCPAITARFSLLASQNEPWKLISGKWKAQSSDRQRTSCPYLLHQIDTGGPFARYLIQCCFFQYEVAHIRDVDSHFQVPCNCTRKSGCCE